MQMNRQDTQKIHEALTLLNEVAKEKKENVRDLLGDKYQALKEAVGEVKEEASGKAHEGVERLEELKETVTDRARSTAERVDRKVHEDPWKMLGFPIIGAFAVGFLLGRKD
jgi:ElaB/YqjD/DUF883 family membrane-anchored ribosome-binding protein